jgi:hypothetical protein
MNSRDMIKELQKDGWYEEESSRSSDKRGGYFGGVGADLVGVGVG